MHLSVVSALIYVELRRGNRPVVAGGAACKGDRGGAACKGERGVPNCASSIEPLPGRLPPAEAADREEVGTSRLAFTGFDGGK